VVMVVLGSTLGVVYTQSQAMIETQAEQKTVLLIQTINSSLEAGIPDFDFETILLHLRQQNHAILSFNIYKLNGYFYDIASTDPKRIGKRAPVAEQRVMERGVTVTTMRDGVLHIVSPVLINGVTLYSSDVQYSMAGDLKSTGVLLLRFLLVGLAAIVLAALILWGFSRQLLSRPLHTITAAANDIAGANLQIDLMGLDRRTDEIGMLARSFDRMARQLQSMITGISQTSEELRTAFQHLVTNGDSTAHSALHMCDVMDHMGREMRLQVVDLDRLAALIGQLAATAESLGEAQEKRGGGGAESEESVAQVHARIVELAQFCEKIQVQARDLQSGLGAVVATANGQLERVQEANRSIARLKELSTELQKLTAIFDMV
jgi:methyl-accepting chemotaxis protein